MNNIQRRLQQRRSAAGTRRGLTLVEVLMSVGVASIGLIGVLLLVPVGTHQAQTGAVLDRTVLIAQEAYDVLAMQQLPPNHPKLLAATEIGNRWFFPQDNKEGRFRYLATIEDHTQPFDDPLTPDISPDIPAAQYPAQTYRVRVEVYYGYKNIDANGHALGPWNVLAPNENTQNKPTGIYRRPLKLGVQSLMTR